MMPTNVLHEQVKPRRICTVAARYTVKCLAAGVGKVIVDDAGLRDRIAVP
jgi:hypothetical protein